MTAPLLGAVAVVGFPNVGKSTLVNRLSATREAVVFETPGVTRDRKEVVCEWSGKRFILVDTGGVDVVDPSPLTRDIAEQARRAVEEADLVLFVVDTRTGVTPGTRRSPASFGERTDRLSSSRTRWTTPRATPPPTSSIGSAWATRFRSPPCTATAPATFWMRSSLRYRARDRRRQARRRFE